LEVQCLVLAALVRVGRELFPWSQVSFPRFLFSSPTARFSVPFDQSTIRLLSFLQVFRAPSPSLLQDPASSLLRAPSAFGVLSTPPVHPFREQPTSPVPPCDTCESFVSFQVDRFDSKVVLSVVALFFSLCLLGGHD